MNGPERVSGIFLPRADEGIPRSAFVHHCDVCALRLRELQLHRHADWRHRGAGSEPEIAARQVWHPRDAGGHDGQPDVRFDCGNLFEMSAAEKAKGKPSVDFVRAERAAKFILAKTKLRPRIGLVLGSGLGAFANELAGAARIDYAKIPHFPRSTAIGHTGRLVLGRVGEVPVAAMQGRVHFYEGYTIREVIFPMRVMARMGIRAVILTNAAGGINTGFKQGCLVALRDHINLQGTNPLIGPNEDRFGVRFPDLTQVYWTPYRVAALKEGRRLGIEMYEGTNTAL